MKDETVARFILREKILKMIDVLKKDDKYGNDPSNVVEFAILQLYHESKDDVEKISDDMIDRELLRQQLQDKEEEDKENMYCTYKIPLTEDYNKNKQETSFSKYNQNGAIAIAINIEIFRSIDENIASTIIREGRNIPILDTDGFCTDIVEEGNDFPCHEFGLE